MNKSFRLLLAGGAIALAGCGGTETEEFAQTDEALVAGHDQGAAMGDGFHQNANPNQSVELAPTGQATICPGSTVVHGIDVSIYQGTINFASVKAAGKSFVLIRASDGTGNLDANFASNWSKAKAAGMTVGAYQFFRPNEDPTAQADLIINKVQAAGYVSTDMPIVIDLEVTSGMSVATINSRVQTWLQRVQSRTGRLPMLYTSPSFWSSLGNPSPTPLPYLWDAHWGATCPTVQPPWGRLRCWQYSSTGSVSGISGAVDLDLYNGSLTELRSL